MSGQGDFVNPIAWQDQNGKVPPSIFNNIPPGHNLSNIGDGRYWWTGNASTIAPVSATMLLHFDGTNGSTTFTDSSAIPHVFTSSGAAALTTANEKFGTASLAVAASTNGGVKTPDAVDINAVFTGDFTISVWVYNTATPSASHFIAAKQAFTSVFPFQLLMLSDGRLNANGSDSFGTTQYNITDSVVFPTNSWQLVTLVRFGSVFTLYRNGVVIGSQTYAGTLGANTGAFTIGQDASGGNQFLGNIDEFGMFPAALYKAAFTPPTAPFTPVVLPASIVFIGDPTFLTDKVALTWQIYNLSNDGSAPVITYSTDGGATFASVTLPLGLQGLQSGAVDVSLTSAAGIVVSVYYQGGVFNPAATNSVVAMAITRNQREAPPWDTPNPFDPIGYNAQRGDLAGFNTDTLGNLRSRLLIDLGFASQASNPTPGMALFVNSKLNGAQTYLYRRYTALQTQRLFRWKIIPGQRHYSLLDNDDDAIANFHIDPLKPITWAGVQDTRNVWYPIIEGIPPQLYTMITKPWRPARYTVKRAIEIYPAPDQTYWLWLYGHLALTQMAADGDKTVIDSELVFLHALANAKAHYGQPDANNIEAQANTYRQELIAGTHATAHYIPGAIAVPPAVRPTLIQYQDNQSG